MKIEQRKGLQLHEAFGAVLVVILLAVLVIVSIYLFSNLKKTFTGTIAQTTINESGTVVAAGYVLANASNCGFASPTIIQITNHTNGAVIVPANYTLVGNIIKNTSVASWGSADITYSYYDGGAQCVATQTSITNFSNYPALVGLVGVIVFLGLVIGVLVASFVFGGKKGA